MGSLKKYFLLLLFFMGAAGLKAQQTDTLPHTLLWKIEGKGMKKPSYLYGTMHVSSDKAFHLMDSVTIALESCSAFAAEINMDSLDLMALAAQMQMEDGQTINHLLSDTDYRLVSNYMQKTMGIPLFLFKTIKPVIILFTLQGKSLGEDNKDSLHKVLDMFLFDLAKQDGKQVMGLETAESQLALLSDMPLEDQAKQLVQGVRNMIKEDTSGEAPEDIVAEYENRDLNQVYKETVSDTSMGPDFIDKFINKRNRGMADGMERVMNDKTLFTAVGAAHLPGPKGIIALLRKDGYKVSPVLSTKFTDPEKVKALLKPH
jgi:uncharacterized protein YbaP (TraB family)